MRKNKINKKRKRTKCIETPPKQKNIERQENNIFGGICAEI